VSTLNGNLFRTPIQNQATNKGKDMNNQELDWVLEDFKREFLLLVKEERFTEADEVYQQYRLVKEARDAQPPSPVAKEPSGAK
jgi:hypothetical protein